MYVGISKQRTLQRGECCKFSACICICAPSFFVGSVIVGSIIQDSRMKSTDLSWTSVQNSSGPNFPDSARLNGAPRAWRYSVQCAHGPTSYAISVTVWINLHLSQLSQVTTQLLARKWQEPALDKVNFNQESIEILAFPGPFRFQLPIRSTL